MTDAGFLKTYVFYKILNDLSPQYLTKYVNLRSASNYQTRFASKNNSKKFSAELKVLSIFITICVREWNKLGNTIQDAESIKQFKSMLKTFFL